jgi:hypothetical protein
MPAIFRMRTISISIIYIKKIKKNKKKLYRNEGRNGSTGLTTFDYP